MGLRSDSGGRRVIPPFAICFAAALVVVFFLQFSITGSVWESLFKGRIFRLLANMLLPLTALCVLSLWFSVRKLAVVSTVAALAFAVFNHLKIANLEEPILIYDLYKLTTSPLLAKYVTLRELLLLIASVFVAGLLLRRWGPDRAARQRRSWKTTVAPLVLSVLSLGVILEGYAVTSFFPGAVPYRAYEQLWTAKEYGYFLAQARNLQYLRVKKPAGYSQERVARILPAPGRAVRNDALAKRPDVVVVLLESFYDYYGRGLKLDGDFIPFFHQLKREAIARPFLSPTFGGGTANVEFEVLTGLRTLFLPLGSVPYAQYLKHGTPGVPALFAENGYRTIAIHNNSGNFWSRRAVYPHLGFETFLADTELRKEFGLGNSVADRYIFEKSLRLLRERRDRPDFHFVISYETHSPYRGTKPSRRWLSEDIAAEAIQQFGFYADKMQDFDSDLAFYFEGLRKLKNPPIVILFGDHQPGISASLPLRQTPESVREVETLFWNWKAQAPGGTRMDLACLSAQILEAGGISPPPFFRFVKEFCANHPVLRPGDVENVGLDSLVGRYQVLCFDRLFGARYSAHMKEN